MNWIPLHVHDHFSLLDGLSKPYQLTERLVNCGYNACAITNHGSINSAVDIIKAFSTTCKCGHPKNLHLGKCCGKNCKCTSFEKYTIKPILGNELYISKQLATIKDSSNRSLSHLCVLARNLSGWKELIKITSEANLKENIYYAKPRLSLEQLAKLKPTNLIAFSGHPGSDLANILFLDIKRAYASSTEEDARGLLKPDAFEQAVKLAGLYQEIFGKNNFYLEIQLIDRIVLPVQVVIVEILRKVSKATGIPCIATSDSHYCTKEQAPDQRVQIASSLQTTLQTVKYNIENSIEFGLSTFFKSNNYHVPTTQEILDVGNTEEEIKNTIKIAEECELYNILRKPSLPDFTCSDGRSSVEYLTFLAKQGLEQKKKNLNEVYVNRLKSELDIICSYDVLASYFLITQDYINWARSQGQMIGVARGSVGGSLAAYVLKITSLDPIKHDLVFERFYNAGRNTVDRVALPDIDTDFSKKGRDETIKYVESKYGVDKVSRISTYQTMKGKGALKDVLRAHDACSFDMMNQITEYIPNDAAISDDLQEMKEEEGESSVIIWALQNNAEKLKEWCYLDKNGELQGEYKRFFAQAIRLEGTKRSAGCHPSGIIIAKENLAESCPMIYDDNTGGYRSGFDMYAIEDLGFPKFDFLSLSLLDKFSDVQKFIRTGDFGDDD